MRLMVFELHRELFGTALPSPWPHEGSPEELARWISKELASHALFPPAEAESKRLPQLMIFVSHCAPPGASTDALRLACGFLIAFFLFNDDWRRHGARFAEPEGAPYVKAWLARFEARFGARAARFLAAFEQYRQSLFVEQRLRERPERPTLEAYMSREHGRYQWVATAPYIELWEVATELGLREAERASAERLQALGVELTYIANDIGSLRRDHRSPNFVTLLTERYPGLFTLPELLEAARTEYTARARAFDALREGATGELARYASLVAAVTDGNLRATLLLARSGDAGRYASETRECLESLATLGAR
jgi:Terpene synthase family 2, C-terminal metal binding